MLYVLLIIAFMLLLIVALLFVSINLRVHYDDESEFKCTLSYLFVKFTLLPQDEEKKRKKEEKKKKKQEKLRKKGKPVKEEKEKISFSQMFKDKGIRGFLDDIKALVSSIWQLLMSALHRASIKNLQIRLNVAGDDAADTAIIYGYANSVVYPIVSAVLENVAECEDYAVEIDADFSENAEASVYLDVHLKIKPVKLLGALIENRASAEKLINEVSKNSKDKKE